MNNIAKFLFLFFLATNVYSSELVKDLKDLSSLYNKGLISEDEFKKAKKIIIDKQSKPKVNSKIKKTKKDFIKPVLDKKNFEKFMKIHNDISKGKSYFKINWGNINGKYDDFRWDDQKISFYLKNMKLVCYGDNPYLMYDIVMPSQRTSLSCSNGKIIKKLYLKLHSTYGNAPLDLKGVDSENINLEMRVYIFHGDN